MATAADVIRRAMKLLGVLAAGETPSAEEQDDGLMELNLMLGSWANERTLVYGTRRNTYTLTPSLSPHTIGVTGTFATTRPLRIEGAGVVMPGTTAELPLDILTDAQYQYIVDKTLTSDIPTRLWVEETYPNANLWFWPVPTQPATLALYTWSRIASFAASDVVSLPDGYEDALGYGLALRLADQFNKPITPQLQMRADESLASIQRTNQPDVASELDAGLLGPRVFNIHTG